MLIGRRCERTAPPKTPCTTQSTANHWLRTEPRTLPSGAPPSSYSAFGTKIHNYEDVLIIFIFAQLCDTRYVPKVVRTEKDLFSDPPTCSFCRLSSPRTALRSGAHTLAPPGHLSGCGPRAPRWWLATGTQCLASSGTTPGPLSNTGGTSPRRYPSCPASSTPLPASHKGRQAVSGTVFHPHRPLRSTHHHMCPPNRALAARHGPSVLTGSCESLQRGPRTAATPDKAVEGLRTSIWPCTTR